MRKFIPIALLLVLSTTSCDDSYFTIPTFPAPPPTITPSIFSPTPRIVTVTNTSAPEIPTTTSTDIPTEIIPTETATTYTETETPTPTEGSTLPPVSPNIIVEVIGCNTSIDITHGMGEVTNAFVVLKNSTGADFVNLCTTLYALDEGRVHPDKTVCVPGLGHGFQVTLKLTVDSTFRAETPIQVEVKSGETLLSRIGQDSCTDIGLFGPNPGSLSTPVVME